MTALFVPDTSARVLVLGDIILDRYVHGETTRISPEAPVPVVLVRHSEERAGGAGNVALNISSLGMHVSLLGPTGADAAADALTQLLAAGRVRCRFLRQEQFPTITKLRVLSQHQQLLRLDYEAPPEQSDVGSVLAAFQDEAADADVVVLSDYAKGSLRQVESCITHCRNKNIKVLVDPKGTDFRRYRGATLLTPNLREFEAVVGSCGDNSTLVTRGETLCAELGLEALLVTRGDQGMSLVRPGAAPLHLSTEAREVFDVTGAGDTVIAVMAASLASGYDHAQAMTFANRAAGLVVARLGTASVTAAELNDSRGHVPVGASTDEPRLMDFLAQVRGRGGTVVMTNGCFDILHAGHVRYLQEARQLGDCLVVAVNDDASVERLKGPGRPINPLRQRLEVMQALKSVDYVVPFAEDTPARLIHRVAPDILVKGGDYREDEIAGADFVKKNGGSVRILPLYGEYSTSRIIRKANPGEKTPP